MIRRTGQGALIAIALMFASSGALRLGNGLGLTIARASEDPPVVAATECAAPPDALAAALAERESRLLAEDAAMRDRSAALSLAEAALRGRLEELAEAERALRATLAIADSAAEEDLARLTAVYETMKPRDAAALFDAMDPQFAAGFLGRMRPDAAAAVLAGMTPEKAFAVSAILAGRNARAPRE
ncbi:MotE family protein [Pseudogemmobacter sonorensis]|uniref:MotE family protein n=1 Tax=Pseudogemmobacter sonorensis TaxID=2989681 RepID=UPI00369F4BEA